MAHDVDEATFERDVITRSAAVPVVVDFWAEWCAPCRQLGPALEAEAAKREELVDLVKVDVDSNQGLSARFGVQGIPAVKAFRDGEVAAEFTGAIPPAKVAAFFDSLVPSEADALAEADDEASLRRALDLDPTQSQAATKLARLLMARSEDAEAAAVLGPFASDFTASGLLARIELADDPAVAPALVAWDGGEIERALELLQDQVAISDDPERIDLLRRIMVAIFTELGPDSELARDHRRRLSLVIV